jgi:mannitol/fructose-specific phosphotransferase system IIA component (Ntr-type)
MSLRPGLHSSMTFGQFTEPRLLVPRLLSDRGDRAVHELARRLEATGRIHSAKAFVSAVLERDAALSMVIADGVVAPHARGGAVTRLSVAVGLSENGIPWGKNGRTAARAIFLFAVPLGDAAGFLSLLSGLSTLIQDEMAFLALRRATQPEEMLNVLNQIRLARMIAEPAQPALV